MAIVNFGKFFVSSVAVFLAHTPIWIYLLVKYLLSPEGFWQNLVLFGLGVWFLGIIQVVLWVVLVFLLIGIWTE